MMKFFVTVFIYKTFSDCLSIGNGRLRDGSVKKKNNNLVAYFNLDYFYFLIMNFALFY